MISLDDTLFDDQLLDLLDDYVDEQHDTSTKYDETEKLSHSDSLSVSSKNTSTDNLLPSKNNITKTFRRSRNRKRNYLAVFDSSELPFFKSPKKDIRRSYAFMLYNILNAHNLVKFGSYLKNYCHINLSLEGCSMLADNQVNMYGYKMILEYLSGKFFSMPDTVYIVNETKILTLLEENYSKVEMLVTLKGTKLFDLPAEEWVPTYFEKNLKSEFYLLKPDETDRNLDLIPIDKKVNIRENFQIKQKPISICLDRKFTIYLDSNNYIEKFILEPVQ